LPGSCCCLLALLNNLQTGVSQHHHHTWEAKQWAPFACLSICVFQQLCVGVRLQGESANVHLLNMLNFSRVVLLA
jgi:hypothetical protein